MTHHGNVGTRLPSVRRAGQHFDPRRNHEQRHAPTTGATTGRATAGYGIVRRYGPLGLVRCRYAVHRVTPSWVTLLRGVHRGRYEGRETLDNLARRGSAGPQRAQQCHQMDRPRRPTRQPRLPAKRWTSDSTLCCGRNGPSAVGEAPQLTAFPRLLVLKPDLLSIGSGVDMSTAQQEPGGRALPGVAARAY